MDKAINFGIIGAGRIARKFAEGISYVKEANLIGIASRNMDKANGFGDTYGVEYRYDNYEDLVRNKDVDVVYIATPNGLHKEHALLCFNHNKPVICEKPFAANKADVEVMINKAKEKNLFLMEAMWTRFFPLVKRVKEMIHDGVIGKVKMIKGDFGYKSDTAYEDIRFNKDLAGGAIMDVGIYPISFASMIFECRPNEIKVISDIGPTGVDEQTSVILGYEEGRMALIGCAIMTETPKNVFIIGEKGYIQIPNVWFDAQKAIVEVIGREKEMINIPKEGNGYNYEVEEVVKCLKEGKLESDFITLNESLEIQETLDIIRQQIGVI